MKLGFTSAVTILLVLSLYSTEAPAPDRPVVIFAAFATNYAGRSQGETIPTKKVIQNLIQIVGDVLATSKQAVVYVNDLERIPRSVITLLESEFGGRVRAIPLPGDVSTIALPSVDKVFLTHPERGEMLNVTAIAAERFKGKAGQIIIDTLFPEIETTFLNKQITLTRSAEPPLEYRHPEGGRSSLTAVRYEVPSTVVETEIVTELANFDRRNPPKTWVQKFFKCLGAAR